MINGDASVSLFYEMANYKFPSSGLHYPVWITNKDESQKDHEQQLQHGPRIKYGPGGTRLVPVIISKEPWIPDSVKEKQIAECFKGEDQKHLFAFIKRNCQTLLDYWYLRISRMEMEKKVYETESKLKKKRKYTRYRLIDDTVEIDEILDEILSDIGWDE